MKLPKKSLGQHWLTDPLALEAIVEAAEIRKKDTVLEIGPGLGHLTNYLLSQAGHVVAVELDKYLIPRLSYRFTGRNLTLHAGDILRFDLTQLPSGYKIVANIPYYLTSHLLKILSESANPPQMMVLLLQKEVADRITADPGQMSLLAISVQLYYQAELGLKVPAQLFEPPPKVDSQVVILRRHTKPLFHNLDSVKYFQIVKAGFAGRRKKLRSSLSGGLHINKSKVDTILKKAGLDGEKRAQNLSLQDWYRIYKFLQPPA